MNNPGVKEEIWHNLRQKWETLLAEGHTVRLEFNVLKDSRDESSARAIDVAQHINGKWYVQTVQREIKEAHAVVGIEGKGLDQLVNIAARVVNTVTEPVTGRKTYGDEMHLFMKRISPEASEMYGYVISKNGEKISVRSNYQHYYIFNEILEQTSAIMQEEYSGIEVHRKRDDQGRLYYRFLHPGQSSSSVASLKEAA